MREVKMVAANRPKVIYCYEDIGRGYFPIDMLRYDNCWPAAEDNDISLSFDCRFRAAYPEHGFRILITGYNTPTVGRWNSFGYSVK